MSQKKNDKQGFPNIVPLQYRQMGNFWYSSMLLSYIMHSPNAYFQKVLEDAKVAANWGQVQRPMLSMHVRHGDSCSEIEESLTMRHCEPLSVYMETAVLPMWRRYVFALSKHIDGAPLIVLLVCALAGTALSLSF